ncbi:hypothetical protein CEXT_32641 [Caerostris extrusa]|uniref:Uncharacterized protein n=1 Tax=Caerostris extrusa TaxID=172846 RepID=A0AAV4SJB1_CAEEX|nr:hypothetical protein CEXT_32641 [Caerostris extrusa]
MAFQVRPKEVVELPFRENKPIRSHTILDNTHPAIHLLRASRGTTTFCLFFFPFLGTFITYQPFLRCRGRFIFIVSCRLNVWDLALAAKSII